MTISDALHRLLLDNLTTATILLNAELRLEYMNPAAEMLLAISGHPPRALRRSGRHTVRASCTGTSSPETFLWRRMAR